MAKTITLGNRKLHISLTDFIFLLYVITVTTFTRGEGFDSILSRGMFVLLSLCLIYVVGMKNRWQMKVNFQFFGYILFWGFYLLSCLWGNTADGLYYIQRLVQAIAVSLFLANTVSDEKDVEKYMRYIYVALIAFSVRLLLVTPLTSWGNTRIGEELNLKATHVGMMCTFGVLLALYFSEKHKFNFVFLAFFTTIILFSGTRTSIIMIAVGLLVYLFLKEKGRKRYKWILIAAVVLVALFFVIMKVPFFYNIIGFRMDKIIYSVSGSTIGVDSAGVNLKDFSATEREYFRETAFKLFRQKPFFGMGANGFFTYMKQIGYIHTTFSHCNYTELLSTLGITGFLIYYIIQLRTVVLSFGYFRKSRNHLYLLVLAIMVSCLVGDYSTVNYISVIIQIILCLCGNLSNFALKQLKGKPASAAEE